MTMTPVEHPSLQETFGLYEFNAKLCGDRPVLKLSPEEAMQVVSVHIPQLVDLPRFRSHSILLNRVAWELHDALGVIPEGAEQYVGDIEADLPEICRLIRAAKAAGL